MNEHDSPSRFPIARASVTLAAAALVGAALAGAALVASDHQWLLGEAVATAGIALAVALLAQLPVWRAGRKGDADALPMGMLAGLMVRLGLTVGAVPLAWGGTGMNLLALAGWSAGWYLLLLIVEIVMLCRFLMQVEMARKEGAAC